MPDRSTKDNEDIVS